MTFTRRNAISLCIPSLRIVATSTAIVVLCGMPSVGGLWAQCQWATGSGGAIYYNGGSVGIGTSAPSAPLDVNSAGDFVANFSSGGHNSFVQFSSLNGAVAVGNGWGSYQANVVAGSMYIWKINWSEQMRLDANGNLGIGTETPQSKLSVNGAITAKEVVVTNTGWADYVFEPGYHLRPLDEIAVYVQKHRKLPDMPDETEVRTNGIGVGEMQVKLLEKIEELTLHLIQLDEKNAQLERKNRELEQRVAHAEATEKR